MYAATISHEFRVSQRNRCLMGAELCTTVCDGKNQHAIPKCWKREGRSVRVLPGSPPTLCLGRAYDRSARLRRNRDVPTSGSATHWPIGPTARSRRPPQQPACNFRSCRTSILRPMVQQFPQRHTPGKQGDRCSPLGQPRTGKPSGWHKRQNTPQNRSRLPLPGPENFQIESALAEARQSSPQGQPRTR